MDEEFIKTYLAVQHGPHGQELLDNLALNLARLACLMDATVAPNPANVSHRGLDTLDMELVLQAHRQTVEFVWVIICGRVPSITLAFHTIFRERP